MPDTNLHALVKELLLLLPDERGTFASLVASENALAPADEGRADYLIATNGTTVVAKALSSDLTDIVGSDSATVFQAAIDSLRVRGGVVGFKGIHTFTSGITVYPTVGLVGQGPVNQGSQGTNLIKATSAVTGAIITVLLDPSNTTWVSFPWLSNFSISGTHGQTGQDGILVSDVNGTIFDFFFDKVLVFDVGGNGLNVSNNGKGWVTQCYFERSQQNGVRASKGTLLIRDCYIQNNVLFGVDATSSGLVRMFGNYVWQNAGGGVQIWSMTSGAQIVGNVFADNGDNTHPVIVLKSNTAVLYRVLIALNQMVDSRVSTSACQYFVASTFGSYGRILGNTFSGQKSGNPACFITAHAADNFVIRDNDGFNPVGKITNPIDTANGRCGIAGSTAVPAASTDYTVAHVDQYLVISGGTGTSISIKDAAGNVVESGLASFAKILPVGYKWNAGAFSVAPTVASFGQ